MTNEQYDEISKVKNECDRLQNVIKKLDALLSKGHIAQADGKYYMWDIDYDYPYDGALCFDRDEIETLKNCLSNKLSIAQEQFENL